MPTGSIEENFRAVGEVWMAEAHRLPTTFARNAHALRRDVGLSSVWLALRYWCHHVIAVEASPANACLA